MSRALLTPKAIVKAKLFVSSFTLMLLMASGEGLERTNRSALRCQKIYIFWAQPKYILFPKNLSTQKLKDK
jgi:hypothetical protein